LKETLSRQTGMKKASLMVMYQAISDIRMTLGISHHQKMMDMIKATYLQRRSKL
jgi:hypothetical protein